MNLNLSRLLRTRLLLAMLVLAAWIAARSPLPTVSAQSPVVGSGPNRAGVVVRFDDGRIETRCVAFEEEEIGGDELLERSGLNDIVIDYAGTVCRIDGKGCEPEECFCQCPFPNCEYWAYYYREDGAWTYSQVGAFSRIITNGALDGWSWGPGNFQSGVEPPQMEFEQVCPSVEPENTATPTPAPPLVTFVATAPTLAAGQCTHLNWQTTGATTVSLDGVSVDMQGSQEVCPAANQTWTLIAANAAGQTTRQVSITVQGTTAGAVTPTASPSPVITATPTARPSVSASRPAAPTLPVRTTAPVITRAPQPLPGATVASIFPPSPTPDLSAGALALAPPVEPSPVIVPTRNPTATRFSFTLPPTETPRPRRALGAGGPTPTPLLIARAAVGSSGSSAQGAAPANRSAANNSAARAQSAESRSFSPSLLPGYAAYVATVAVLLIMAWYVLRRRHAPVRAPVAAPTGGKDE